MGKPSVFVTRRWPNAVESRLSETYDTTFNRQDRALTPTELKEALIKYDAILPTVTDSLNAEVLDVASPKTRFLGNFGVGYSHFCEYSSLDLGLTVTNTPGVLSECTAALTIMLMLMVARRAGEGERELRSGKWSGWAPTHMVGTKVSGKRLGIIGFGRIGQEVARRAHHGFGMNVVVYNRSAISSKALAECGARQVDTLDELIPQCDFLSLHCPGGSSNRHLINAERLRLMNRDAYIINTARGEVIDEFALAEALEDGSIGGAALDVFEGEPIINASLLECGKTVLLPHLGSATLETRQAMGFRVIENLDDFFEGREPRDRVI